MPLDRSEILRHATDWIAAWNRRDVAAVLAAFAEDASFRSPYAESVVGSTLVSGKAEMETYWTSALRRIASLDFELLSAVCDVDAQTMVVHYLARLDGPPRRACELFRFEGDRKVYAEALYGGLDGEAV
jgi:ketosteroid isomerase-like protein